MGSRTSSKTRVARPSTATTPVDEDAAFQRAILKIAVELKKPSASSYDEVVERTIRAMRLDPDRFRHYLGANGARGMGLLLAAAREGGGNKFGP